MAHEVGQVVYAKCGREEGKPFVVIGIEGDYLWLADGTHRTLEKPKRKKKKHVQTTGYVSESIREKLFSGKYLLDAELAKFLKECSGRA